MKPGSFGRSGSVLVGQIAWQQGLAFVLDTAAGQVCPQDIQRWHIIMARHGPEVTEVRFCSLRLISPVSSTSQTPPRI